jgi:hypothetical protein
VAVGLNGTPTADVYMTLGASDLVLLLFQNPTHSRVFGQGPGSSDQGFSIFPAFVVRISYFRVRNRTKSPFSERKHYLLETGRYGCQKIRNFMLISEPKEYFGGKKVRP